MSRVGLNGSSYYHVLVEDYGRDVSDDRKAEIFNRLKRGDPRERALALAGTS